MNHITEDKCQRIKFLEHQIGKGGPLKSLMESVSDVSDQNNAVTGMSEIEQNKVELDELIASECLLCGEVMIQSITTPFFNSNNHSLISSWQL